MIDSLNKTTKKFKAMEITIKIEMPLPYIMDFQEFSAYLTVTQGLMRAQLPENQTIIDVKAISTSDSKGKLQ